jgi:AcrR family transcriptional regulator
MITRTPRADAARNRQAVICAARRVLAEHGESAGMEEIASAAGVGIGTLYRHFPTKTDLVSAILAEQLAAFVALAESDADRPPWDRLVAVITALIEAQSTDRAMSNAPTCEIATSRPELVDVRDRLSNRLARLLDEAAASGEVRADVEAGDLLALCFNRHLAGNADGWRRYAAIVIDGLRARPAKEPA